MAISGGTPEERANYQIIADGHGVHWPDIDEDISAEGMLYGTPAHRPKLTKVKYKKTRVGVEVQGFL